MKKNRNYFDSEDFDEIYNAVYGRMTAPNTADMDQTIHCNPHYTDDHYKHPQTIFGKEEKGLEYAYSDRLYQWDHIKEAEARNVANSSKAKRDTARWFQIYLTAYFGKPVILKHILAGVNWGNGYPYQVFGYKFEDKG
jgi:hypothetical protein